MKTVKKSGETPIRVKDKKAMELTTVGYEYCPKSEFKALRPEKTVKPEKTKKASKTK